jgi:ribosomal protein L18
MSATQSSIKSEERSLGSILGDKRPLKVPTYQRNFSWAKAQISDLWDDIQSILYDNQDNYFLGSMVFIQRSDNSLDVVDGQQRLATVSLFLAAIRDGFGAASDTARAQHVETHYLCSRNLKSMEALPKLSLNETDNDLYWQIIDSKKKYDDLLALSRNKEIVESNRLMAQAYVALYDLAKKGSANFTNTSYLSTLVEAVTDNISCIQVITNNEDSAYVLFETLNDRGIDLTLSDMLKNFLFSKAGKRIEEAKNQWTQIVAFVGQEHMKTFIRHEWMSKYGQTREKELYKKIKSEVRTNPKAIEYIANLRTCANIYDAIRNPDHDIWSPLGPKCQHLLEELLVLGPIQCYPLILSTYLVNPKELSRVLDWIVSLTVRYSIICGKGTGNLETAYAKASSTMRKNSGHLKDVKESLLNIWPNDDEFKSAFKEKTFTTPGIIKYLFAKLEATIAEDLSLIPNPESLTVEHILPRRPGPKWPAPMRSDEYLKQYLTKIGNLTILTDPMNRECESREFTFKKSIYQDSKFKITQELCSVPNWTAEEIERRQARLADVAARTWLL